MGKITKEEMLSTGWFEHLHDEVYGIRMLTAFSILYHANTSILEVRVKHSATGFSKPITGKEHLAKCLFPFIDHTIEFKEVKYYNWNTCSSRQGFSINDEGLVSEHYPAISKGFGARMLFRNVLEAESSFAAAQLSHVTHKINEDFPNTTSKDNQYNVFTPVWNNETRQYVAKPFHNSLQLKVCTDSEQGCKILIRDNKELLDQLYGINQ